MADRTSRPVQLPERADLPLEHLRTQVLTHTGRMPARQDEAVERLRVQVRPADRRGELLAPDELFVETPGLLRGAELPEEDPGQQPRGAGGPGPGALGGEDDVVTGVGEQPPGHG